MNAQNAFDPNLVFELGAAALDEPRPLSAARISVRFTVDDPAAVDLDAYVPAFHEALKADRIPGELLVDVASYAHVPGGPGLLLVGANAHYGLTAGPRAALSRTQRRPWARRPIERIGTSLARTLALARLLTERHPAFRIRTDEVEVTILDRLLAPNTRATFLHVAPAISAFFRELYAGDVEVSPSGADRAPFAVRVRAERAPGVEALAQTLAPFQTSS